MTPSSKFNPRRAGSRWPGLILIAALAFSPTIPARAQSVVPPASSQENPDLAPPEPASGRARTAESATTPTSPQGPKLRRHTQFLDRIKEGNMGLLFVGDSITDYWPRTGEWSWMKFAPYNPANFGVGGERTEQVLWRLTNGELEGISPKVVVLLIGTNNFGGGKREKPEWAAAGVTKIVRTIHAKLPQTKVLLLAIFPRSKKNDPLRTKVAGVNTIIARLDDGVATRFLDLGHVFLDAEGEIPADIMADGLHPTAKGYDLWYEAMKPTLDEMMK